MVITHTWHKLQPDAEKYGRELREDCSVKRVAREPALVKADERLQENRCLWTECKLVRFHFQVQELKNN